MNDGASWKRGAEAAAKAVETRYPEGDPRRGAVQCLADALRALTPPPGPETVVLTREEAGLFHELLEEDQARADYNGVAWRTDRAMALDRMEARDG